MALSVFLGERLSSELQPQMTELRSLAAHFLHLIRHSDFSIQVCACVCMYVGGWMCACVDVCVCVYMRVWMCMWVSVPVCSFAVD